ncbi:MAG TPA: DUF1990 family protein [Solirubrobacterales bacterium]|nr:DUF1990 family protein [Solirubrobacterales bacterium]
MSDIPARMRNRLIELYDKPTNFDGDDLPQAVRDPWHIDDYRHALPAEEPGEPTSGGSFEIAKRLLADYEFADPRVVRAFYDAEAPLLGRTMLLQIRFYVIHTYAGVRVSEIFDERRDAGGRPVRIWGWAYQTLEGHPERGQMDYQLWKHMDTGEVELRIHAVSELIGTSNPIIGIGFALVGRREQVRFARRCGSRMERLVVESLEHGRTVEPAPDVERGVAISPADD